MTTATGFTGAMFSCPAPQWATGPTDWHMGTSDHHRFANRPLGVCAWLEQLDELDMSDGVGTFVRYEPTITFQFDNKGVTDYDSDFLPLDQFRDGRLPALPDTITADRVALARDAVAELLAAHDARNERRPRTQMGLGS